MSARGPLLALVLAAVVVLGCGDEDDPGRQLTVSAASSLKRALEPYGREFGAAAVRFSFAGSDELAAQIRNGARPDVFAAASAKLPRALHTDRLVDRPVAFATNRLVLATPRGSQIRSLRDLQRSGVKLVVGEPGVPIGSYTREVLGRLPAGQRRRILANVRSEEPDVAGIIGKLTQGAADTGFVYVTDVQGSGGRLEAAELPRALRPPVVYEAAVVEGAKNRQGAREFIDGLRSGPGRDALREAGFGPPPR